MYNRQRATVGVVRGVLLGFIGELVLRVEMGQLHQTLQLRLFQQYLGLFDQVQKIFEYFRTVGESQQRSGNIRFFTSLQAIQFAEKVLQLPLRFRGLTDRDSQRLVLQYRCCEGAELQRQHTIV